MTQQGFPQITSPLVDPKSGRINQVWTQLLVTIWNRTGAGTGISAKDVVTAIQELVFRQNAPDVAVLSEIASLRNEIDGLRGMIAILPDTAQDATPIPVQDPITPGLDPVSLPPDLDSGTYTPSMTNTANITASTAYDCQFSRVGQMVTVSGRVDITPTASATLTTLGISLPIPSAFSASTGYQLGGVGAANQIQQAAGIYADSVNARAKFEFLSATTLNYAMFFTFQYQII